MHIYSAFTSLTLGALLTLAGAASSRAQRLQPVAPTIRHAAVQAAHDAQASRDPVNSVRGIAGGVLGGGAGLFGGLLAGASIGSRGSCSGEDCGLGEAIVGAILGESLGLALGTHVAARGHGNVVLTSVVSTAIGAVGLLAAFSAERAAPLILGAVPIVQLAAVLAMER
jgi:hypothetical protein